MSTNYSFKEQKQLETSYFTDNEKERIKQEKLQEFEIYDANYVDENKKVRPSTYVYIIHNGFSGFKTIRFFNPLMSKFIEKKGYPLYKPAYFDEKYGRTVYEFLWTPSLDMILDSLLENDKLAYKEWWQRKKTLEKQYPEMKEDFFTQEGHELLQRCDTHFKKF